MIVDSMDTINQGINGLSHVQSFMFSEISTISGMVYFLIIVLALMIITSFRCFTKSRISSFCVVALNIFVELLFADLINLIVGVKNVRLGFVLVQIGILIKAFLAKRN